MGGKNDSLRGWEQGEFLIDFLNAKKHRHKKEMDEKTKSLWSNR